MENLTITEVTKKFAGCIHCNKSDAFDITWHILRPGNKEYGPWTCDKCGKSQIITILENGTVQAIPHENVVLKTLDLLSMKRGDETLYIVVEGIRVSVDGKPFEMDNSYFFDDHTCPTNITKDILTFILNGDDDPHGIFEFVKGVPDTRKNKDETCVREMQKLFEMDLGFPVDDDDEGQE